MNVNDAWKSRLVELQRRVRDGTYDNRRVLEQVARRILRSDDL